MKNRKNGLCESFACLCEYCFPIASAIKNSDKVATLGGLYTLPEIL